MSKEYESKSKVGIEPMPTRGKPRAWYVSKMWEKKAFVFKTKKEAIRFYMEKMPDVDSSIGWLWHRGDVLPYEHQIGEKYQIVDFIQNEWR